MKAITERILEYNADRLPGVVPMKYKAMTENLFRFYRGTNHIFFSDLIGNPGIPSSPLSWISGDLHIENFGSFKSDNRQVYFDLNDFDEGVLAPVIWESYRMVTSIYIAFESLNIGLDKADHMSKLFLKTYSQALARGKAEYIEANTASGIVKNFLSEVSKRKQRDILAKRTIEHRNKLEILLEDPRHIELKKKQKQDFLEKVADWLKLDARSPYNYKPTDAVFRLAGTGSLGLCRYAVLLKSLNNTGEKYLLVDFKQAIPSSLMSFLPIEQPEWFNEAERAIHIQSMMQNRSPALLSTMEYQGLQYMVQEIQPTRDKINFKLVKKEYRDMIRVVSDMGVLAASAQLRSSGRMGSATAQELIEFGQRQDWQTPVLDYSKDYAQTFQNYFTDYTSDFGKGNMKTKALQALITGMIIILLSSFSSLRSVSYGRNRTIPVYSYRQSA